MTRTSKPNTVQSPVSAAGPHLITCVGVEQPSDLALLGHFLEHYARLGIDPQRMHAILNARQDDAPGLERARAVLAARGLEPAEIWIGPYTSDAMWERRRAVQRRVAAEDEWVVSADVDEFHEYPIDLRRLLAACEARGANCLQGPFVDRLAADGRLRPVDPRVSPFETFPVQAEVMCALAGVGTNHGLGGTVKLMACKGGVLPSRGGHGAIPDGPVAPRYLFGRPLSSFPTVASPRFRFALPLRVHHFKWTDDLVAGLERRLGTEGVSKAGAEYGRKLLDHFRANDGIDLSAVTVRRDDRGSVVAVLPWQAQVGAVRRFGLGMHRMNRLRARLSGAA